MFGKAYLKVQSGLNAVKGFEATGLYPVRRNIFQESDYLAESQDAVPNKEPDNVPSQHRSPQDMALPRVLPNLEQEEETTATKAGKSKLKTASNMQDKPPKQHISPQDIVPLPTLKQKRGTRGRKPGKAKLITASPYIQELETSLNVSQEKIKKVKRNLENNNGKTRDKKMHEHIEGPCTSGISAQHKVVQKQKKSAYDSSEDSDSVELQDSSDNEDLFYAGEKNVEEDAECMFCEATFSNDRPGEIWIKCLLCHKWAHEACSGAVNDNFVCDFCK